MTQPTHPTHTKRLPDNPAGAGTFPVLQSNICDEIVRGLTDGIVSLDVFDGKPPIELGTLGNIFLGRPANEALGDFSSNVAFQISKILRKNPVETATLIAERFKGPAVATAAAPGFINFKVTKKRLIDHLIEIGKEGWAKSSVGAGQKVNVEYVSANPTGALHVGHGRGAVIGDVIARLLSNCGFDVTREYYVNDMGRQIDLLGESILFEARRLSGKDAGGFTSTYGGDRIISAAQAALDAGLSLDKLGMSGDSDSLMSGGTDSLGMSPSNHAISKAAKFGLERLLLEIFDDLERLDIAFDSVIYESSLLENIREMLSEMRNRNLLYEATEPEGAEERIRRSASKAAMHKDEMSGGTFFRTSLFGDEIDRIILRSNGAPTYFTTDIIYHREKFRRGFTRLINVWGADHGGHVKRLKAALSAFDEPSENLEVVLCQMVRLIRAGAEVKMSKRTGDVVSLSELIDEVGPDAVRFFFLSRSPNSQLDFDLDLAVKQSADNPVFYCQYAHARTRQLLAKGIEHGLRPASPSAGGSDVPEVIDMLDHPAEEALLRNLIRLPETIRSAGLRLESHRLTEAAIELAQALHRYQTLGKSQDELRIIRKEEPAISSARLYLVERVGFAMKILLGLMGIRAPERM